MKNNKGITLVALVVTIIVLIILAGISINLVLGDNGIITIAKKAKENTELAKTDEETQLNELYSQLEAGSLDSGNLPYDSIAKLIEFKKRIAEAITNEGVDTPADATAEIMETNIAKILQARTSDATATEENISKGKTAYINGKLLTGNMENYAGQTVTANNITQNGNNAEITIPSPGYYGTDSKLSIPVNDINSNLGGLSKLNKIDSSNISATNANYSIKVPTNTKQLLIILIDGTNYRCNSISSIDGAGYLSHEVRFFYQWSITNVGSYTGTLITCDLDGSGGTLKLNLSPGDAHILTQCSAFIF